MSKLYYSIGEVAKMFNVNASLIRFWEKEFSVINPKKNKKGNRMFTQKDIDNIQRIHKLVKVDGYTLDGAKTALRNSNPSTNNENSKVVSRLEEIKKELEVIKKQL